MNFTSFTPTHSITYQTLPPQTERSEAWRVCSLIPSVYFLSKEMLEWKPGLSRLDVWMYWQDCIRGRARACYCREVQWYSAQTMVTRIHTYVSSSDAKSMHAVEMLRAWAQTHTFWWQVIQHLSFKFLLIWKTAMGEYNSVWDYRQTCVCIFLPVFVRCFMQEIFHNWTEGHSSVVYTTLWRIVLFPFSLPI